MPRNVEATLRTRRNVKEDVVGGSIVVLLHYVAAPKLLVDFQQDGGSFVERGA